MANSIWISEDALESLGVQAENCHGAEPLQRAPTRTMPSGAVGAGPPKDLRLAEPA